MLLIWAPLPLISADSLGFSLLFGAGVLCVCVWIETEQSKIRQFDDSSTRNNELECSMCVCLYYCMLQSLSFSSSFHTLCFHFSAFHLIVSAAQRKSNAIETSPHAILFFFWCIVKLMLDICILIEYMHIKSSSKIRSPNQFIALFWV